jgi:hypothetical protein
MFCSPKCRLASHRQKTDAARARPAATWPEPVAQLQARMRDLEREMQVAPLEHRQGIRRELLSTATKLDELKISSMGAVPCGPQAAEAVKALP